MKKSLMILPLVAALAACSSTNDVFEKRAEREREQKERLVQSALSNAPKWMTELPKSTSAIYQNGTAVSPDMGMSASKAKTMAFGKICVAAGGKVSQQSKIYRLDNENTSTEHSELAIKSFCPSVDISGTEVMEVRMVAEGGKFRTYVLVALPVGEANSVQKLRDEREQRRLAETRSREAFRELDNTKPAQ